MRLEFFALGLSVASFACGCGDAARAGSNASAGGAAGDGASAGNAAGTGVNLGGDAGAGGSATPLGGAPGAGGAPAAEPDAGSGGVGFACAGSAARFATGVVSFSFGGGQSFGQDQFPAAVLGPPKGGGCCAGSLDVTSLGDGGSVTLEFANDVIVDGPGPDFIVFENPFLAVESDPSSVFAELGVVSVSQDGEHWFAFPCSSSAYPFDGCAGWHPVYANADTNGISPLDPSVAGGDAFDLADLGLDYARYVRIDDLTGPGGDGTFDLDAVSIVNPGCP